MPELPDLEVIREFLASRITDVTIQSAEVRRPIVVRNLRTSDSNLGLEGRRFTRIARRGKYLILDLDDGTALVINPMLAGRLRYGEPLRRHRARDVLVLALADGQELRYHDAKDMGKVYLTDDTGKIPGFDALGPEAVDPDLTLEAFHQRLRRHRGEIKWILTNQTFLAGIGNAYADEILWHAGIYPFRRRTSLSDEEIRAVFLAMREVLSTAIQTLHVRIGHTIDAEVRDFMAVHGKKGQPCPRCGGAISEVRRARRATHFCRTCQPGLLVRR